VTVQVTNEIAKLETGIAGVDTTEDTAEAIAVETKSLRPLMIWQWRSRKKLRQKLRGF